MLLLTMLSIQLARAKEIAYIYGTDSKGVTRQLDAARTPALFTRDFGDCLGGESLFNITRFDAAYYEDNSTVLFHLDGTSNIRQESLMLYIVFEAYGERRFEMVFDPCSVNIYSLCPLNATVPVAGWAIFQVGREQLGSIPSIAFQIPDFEGYIKLQIFANSSQTEIGCFQALASNGKSVGQSTAIAPVLVVFAVVAILASFATATYGVSIPHMRAHFAHSMPVLLVFETFQSIFFSGALTVNFPSILVAWWSNFAWSAGQIYSSSIVNSVSSFVGVSGNATQVGGAGSTVINNGGGLVQQIYGRALAMETIASNLVRRADYNASDPYDYTWAGSPIGPGLPLPGDWTGLPGTLSYQGIPAADALIVGLIWLLVAIGLVIACTIAFKWLLEAFIRIKWVREDRLAYFRSHYLTYTGLAVLRTLFIAFFMIMVLSIYQFSLQGSTGATAIAAVAFIVFLGGIGGLVTYACYFRLRFGKYAVEPDRILFTHGKIFKVIPFLVPVRSSRLGDAELPTRPAGSLPFIRVHFIDNDPDRITVHQDSAFIKRFGWLSSRYRRTKWWFFAVYIPAQTFRAAFIGGAATSPLAQVYGLFVYDIIIFVAIVVLNPFEGRRNTAIGVWMLSISKVATTGLSIAFLPEFNLNRIIATVLGVIIMVIQGFLVIALLILIILGVISTYMSLTRNREEFKPEGLEGIRVKFFESVKARAPDARKPMWEKSEKKKGKEKELDEAELQIPKEPYFSVTSVRRAPKIEDEDGDVVADMEAPHNNSVIFDPNKIINRASRTNSISSRYSTHSLPRGARVHRTSWSSRDFAQWDAMQHDRPNSAMANNRLSTNGGFGSAGQAGNAVTGPLGPRARASSSSLRLSTPVSGPSGTPQSPTKPKSPAKETLEEDPEERASEAPAP